MTQNVRAAAVACVSVLAALAASPVTGPTTSPSTTPANDRGTAWHDFAGGRRVLRAFEAAPYPHASRAKGFSSRNGTFAFEGHYDDSTVGVFVPPGFRPGPVTDVIVHFHGWGNHVEKVFAGHRLAEQLVASGRNAVLVVPQGPKDAKDSGCGKLELDDGGLRRLVDEVLEHLKAEGIVPSAGVGRVTLTAHSGGYKVTAAVLRRGGMGEHVTDVVLLDASYGDLDTFVAWAGAAPEQRRLVSFFTEHLKDENDLLKAAFDKAGIRWRQVAEDGFAADTGRGVVFVPTTRPHDAVPEYFGASVRRADLSPRE